MTIAVRAPEGKDWTFPEVPRVRPRRLLSTCGLDLASLRPKVSRPGFVTNIVNEMPMLARWSQPRQILLRPDSLAAFADRAPSSSGRSGSVAGDHGSRSIGIAVPAWLGQADRRQLRQQLDPGNEWSITMMNSTLAAVCGGEFAHEGEAPPANVLCLDLRVGFSASVVVVGHSSVTEVGAWGAADGDRDAPARNVDGLAEVLDRLLDDIARLGLTSIDEILLVVDGAATGDTTPALVCAALDRCAHPWASTPVDVLADHRFVTAGAAMSIEPRRAFDVTSSIARGLAVRSCIRLFNPRMHVIVPQHTRVMTILRQSFDLGPDDGSALHVEIFEQTGMWPSGLSTDHRPVATVGFIGERGYDQRTVAAISIDRDGALAIGPNKAWRTDWHRGPLDVRDMLSD